MKRKLLVFAAFLMGTVLLNGCQSQTQKNSAGETAASQITTDMVGNPIVLPEKTEKIVSLSSSITDILAEMGLAGQLIAIDTYSAEIEGVAEDVMQFDLMKPDTEQIIALGADVVFVTSMSNAGGDDIYKPVRDAGICVAAVPSAESIDEIRESIEFVGSIVGESEKADEIIETMDKEIDAVKEKAATITDKKTVYFEIGAEPKLYTLGTDTFINEMIEVIGAENIFADQSSWITVSEEAVIVKDPDVILTNVGYMDDPVGAVMERSSWQGIQAVKDNQVYYIDKNASSLSSQNIITALKQMAEAVYPEVYKD